MALGALEAGIERQAGIICLQEPPKTDFSHPGYMLYWSGGEKRDQRVLIGVRKDLIGAIRVEHRTDLVDTPYIQCLDIWETAIISGHAPRRTRVVNATTTGSEPVAGGRDPRPGGDVPLRTLIGTHY